MNTPPRLPPLLITSGEPAGIGPELCALIAETNLHTQLHRDLIILGDFHLLNARATAAHIAPQWAPIGTLSPETDTQKPPEIKVLHHPIATPCTTGKPDAANAPYVLALLNTACQACLEGTAAAMVTAPVHKSAISPYWPSFMGHTEYLAQRCGQTEVVMMLTGANMKVALAPTPLPLSQVPQAITQAGLNQTLHILLKDLATYWGNAKPTVLVTGLNPHAGESGHLGQEEIQTITPVIKHFQHLGHQVLGPYPADTLFQPKYLNTADAVLAMYHDQGLPVLKHASFGEGVNISLGLPIIRTSVDHGTALDLAGTRNINSGSLVQAIETAHHMDLCKRRNPT